MTGLPFKALAVAPVTLAPGLNRRSLTRTAGVTRITVARHTRWVAPLAQLLRLSLAQDLAAGISPHKIVRMPGDPLPKRGSGLITVSVEQFRPNMAGTITLVADWWIKDSQGIKARGHVHIKVRGKQTGPSEARSMSLAVAHMANNIIKKLSAAVPNSTATPSARSERRPKMSH